MNITDKPAPLIVIAGPTAAGKTRLAALLARHYGGEVVSADSMQIYRHMDIGTAKPAPEEMLGVPHHLLNIAEPDETFAVPLYARMAREAIADIHARGRLPFLAGGTGLYISAVTENIAFPEMEGSPALREELSALSGEELLCLLREFDPQFAGGFHPNNRRRIIRAIEVYKLTGIPMSEHQARSKLIPAPYRLCMLGITYADRAQLYRRINARVDEMLRQGLLEETKKLLDMGFSASSFQAIGYKEMLPYLHGEISLEEAAENLRRGTRRYAKRQLSWFMRDERIHWLYADKIQDEEALLTQARQIIEGTLG